MAVNDVVDGWAGRPAEGGPAEGGPAEGGPAEGGQCKSVTVKA
jgi:hypothetical protein